MKHYIAFLLLLAATVCSANAQNNKRPVPTLSLKPLQGGVQLIDGGLGNMTLLVSNDEVLIVDTKAEEAGAPLEAMFKNELAGKRIRYIVNTHMHWDHTGNNKLLGKGATIIAQQNARDPMMTDSVSADDGLPNLTFDKETHLFFGGEEIRLIHWPFSHTDHDLIVYFTQSHVVAMGDMYFSGMYPFVAGGGNLDSLIVNLNSIINMLPADVKIVPGHGPVSSLDDLRSTHRMLSETSQYIKMKIESGASLEAVLKDGLPDWTPTWGKGFCNEKCWIETVYHHYHK